MADECKKIVRVIQGSQKTFTVNLRKDGDPLDLSTNEEIRVCVPSADGGAAQHLVDINIGLGVGHTGRRRRLQGFGPFPAGNFKE